MLPPALVALALTVLPSDYPTLPSGERWLYEVETPGDAGRKVQVELSVYDEAPRQRAVVRRPGRSSLELVARPRALVTTLLSPPPAILRGRDGGELGKVDDDAHLGAVKSLIRASRGHVLLECGGRWTGAAWATGSRCGPFEVGSPCSAGGLEGVRLLQVAEPGSAPSGSELCMAPELALPLEATTRHKGKVRFEARLLAHDRELRQPSSVPPPPGLWVRRDAPGLLISADGVLEVLLDEADPRRASRYCGLRPLRYEQAGEVLTVHEGWRVRAAGVLVSTATEYRLVRDASGPRLVTEVADGTRALATGTRLDLAPRCTKELVDYRLPNRPELGVDPGEPNGQNDFVAAVQRDDVDAVRWMLERGVPPGSPPASEESARGANVLALSGGRASSTHGHAPLRLAAAYGFTDIADLLLDYGADANAGLVARHLARPSGVKAQAPDDGEKTPLLLAIDAGVPELVSLLVSRGARWDLGTRSVPHAFASGVQDSRIYAALLAGGAPAGYRETFEAVRERDAGALRAALAGGLWGSDALRLARDAAWEVGVKIAEEAIRSKVLPRQSPPEPVHLTLPQE